MNCSICSTSPYFNYIKKINNINKNKDSIKTNLEGLIYMIKNEKKYNKIIKMIQTSAKYKKENKRYFTKFNGKLMDYNDIILAKNKIFTYESYKCYIKYILYQNGYNNITINSRDNHSCMKKPQNYGYNAVSDDNFDKYINQYKGTYFSDCNKCSPGPYLTKEYINSKIQLYKEFYTEYENACYYTSFIKSKINYIKNSSLNGNTSNICVKFNKKIFPNITSNEYKNIYSGQGILAIYNSVLVQS